MGKKLSICIVAYNEENVVERCLKSIQGLADEVIFIHDGECTDKTIEIAKKYGALIFLCEHSGSAERHRSFSYKKASGEWILQIDADEYLSPEACNKIKEAITSKTVDAYALRWPVYDGEKYVEGDLSKETKLILFRKSKMYYIGTTNETPKTYGKIEERQDITLDHKPLYNNYTFKRLFTKWYFWVDLQAQEMLNWQDADTFNIPNKEESEFVRHYEKLIEHPYLRIFKNYILEDFIKNLKNFSFFHNSVFYTKLTILRYLKFLFLANRLSYHKRRMSKVLTIFVDWQPMTREISGIGFYILNLFKSIAAVDSKNNYKLGVFSVESPLPLESIAKNFKFKKTFLSSSKYLRLLQMKIKVPMEIFFGRSDIYFFGNFLNFPHLFGKTISVVHDLTYIKHPEFMQDQTLAYFSRLIPHTVKHSSILITPSESIRKEIIEAFNFPEDKVYKLYPVIRFDHEMKVSHETDKLFDKIPTKNFALYLGNLEPRKNIIRLVLAYKKLPPEVRSQYSLVLAGGKGWKYDEIVAEIAKPLDIGNIVYLGYISDESKYNLYKKATLFVYPSMYEGFGMPVLEAMFNEVPVITSNLSSMPEIAGDAALLVDPLSIDDITAKIHQLLQDKEMQKLLIKRGQERVNYFKKQNQATQVLKLFQQLS